MLNVQTTQSVNTNITTATNRSSINTGNQTNSNQLNGTNQSSSTTHNNMSGDTLNALTELFQQSSEQLTGENKSDNDGINAGVLEGLAEIENIEELLQNATIEGVNIEDTNQDGTLSAGDAIVITLKDKTDGSTSQISLTLTENDITQFNNIIETLQIDAVTQQVMDALLEGMLFNIYLTSENWLAYFREHSA